MSKPIPPPGSVEVEVKDCYISSTDKNREAFEQWAASEGYLVQKITRPYYGEIYKAESTHHAWKGWQACRDHYAPKLTEKEAVEAATQAIDITAVCERSPEKWAHPEMTNPRACAIAALKATGLRWKEEA